MNTATRNLDIVVSQTKRSVQAAYREVAASPNVDTAPKFIRRLSAAVAALASVDMSKPALKSEDFISTIEKPLSKLESIAEAGFAGHAVKHGKDAKLSKLGHTQTRNTLRPVTFLKTVKDALNAKIPDFNTAAQTLDAMAINLEIGQALTAGDARKAKRLGSKSEHLPSSVMRAVTA